MKRVIIFLVLTVLVNTSFSQVHNSQELTYIDEVNLLRTNPKLYAGFVREFIKAKLIANNLNDTLTLWIAKHELLPLLDTMSPRKALIVNDEVRKLLDLHKGASTLLETRSANPNNYVMMLHDFSMIDTISNYLFNFLGKHKVNAVTVAETIGMSPGDFQRKTIISLLIDRNVPDRSHRNRLVANDITHTSVRRVQDGKNVWWIQEFFSYNRVDNK